MYPLSKLLALPLLALLLTGCAGLWNHETLEEGTGDPASWEKHRQQVTAIDGWQITGKIGIHSPAESGSGTLYWLQRQQYFDLRIAGPLGRGATRLTGRPDGVVMEIAGEGQFEADSPETLLEDQLGWQLPVSSLFWWIRGLPAPDSSSQISLNARSQLAHLSQAGWQIDYLAYTDEAGYPLPARLKLQGKDLELTLVIKEWQPRQLGYP